MTFWLSLISVVFVNFLLSSTLHSGEDWRQLRGDNYGHVKSGHSIPAEWSLEKNVIWRTPVPGHGWSSPVVDGNEIWLTSSLDDQKSLRVICFGKGTGDIRHNIQVFQPEHLVEKHQRNSHATPTPVLDNDNVYVHFGSYGTAALQRKTGQIIWTNQEHKIEHQWGPGGSPVLIDNLLIFNCDGMDSRFVVALDKHTGKTVWKNSRSVMIKKGGFYKKAFSTPAIWKSNGEVKLLTSGANQFDVLDVKDGKEKWNVQYFGYAGVSTPLVHGNVAVITSGYGDNSIMAIQLLPDGENQESDVLWSMSRNAPIIPTPIVVGEDLYMVSDEGIFSCVDLKTGEMNWRERLKGGFAASLTYGDGKIFVPNNRGVTYVVAPDNARMKLLSENRLDSNIQATPAFSDGAMYIRTQKFLYRIQSEQVSSRDHRHDSNAFQVSNH